MSYYLNEGIQEMESKSMDKYFCTECNQPCEIEEETFDYSGTHCNHGQSGIHRTGHYTSKCCDSEFFDEHEHSARIEGEG